MAGLPARRSGGARLNGSVCYHVAHRADRHSGAPAARQHLGESGGTGRRWGSPTAAAPLPGSVPSPRSNMASSSSGRPVGSPQGRRSEIEPLRADDGTPISARCWPSFGPTSGHGLVSRHVSVPEARAAGTGECRPASVDREREAIGDVIASSDRLRTEAVRAARGVPDAAVLEVVLRVFRRLTVLRRATARGCARSGSGDRRAPTLSDVHMGLSRQRTPSRWYQRCLDRSLISTRPPA